MTLTIRVVSLMRYCPPQWQVSISVWAHNDQNANDKLELEIELQHGRVQTLKNIFPWLPAVLRPLKFFPECLSNKSLRSIWRLFASELLPRMFFVSLSTSSTIRRQIRRRNGCVVVVVNVDDCAMTYFCNRQTWNVIETLNQENYGIN